MGVVTLGQIDIAKAASKRVAPWVCVSKTSSGCHPAWLDCTTNTSGYDFRKGQVKWYRLAAEQGNAGVQWKLGLMYDEGRSVLQDDAEALKWYRRAAEGGAAFAQFHLGFMYDEGRGVPQDDAEAVKWYSRAAEQGHDDAQFNLGLMYWEDRGVPQDYAEAAKWYRLAAEQGIALTQYSLGSMYASGRGVPQDYVQAHMWLNLAASLAPATEAEERELPGALPGHTGAQYAPNRRHAIDYRDSVASKLTPAQIAEAQKLAREWKPK